ncbi:hypothetical protein [Erythrobacter mangrovi]|uniref:DUF1311 domain-containing protein n=1 Tax=Erythrobacter mangrovi TaxID=2739433 RepID=A0A7D4CDR7_9SPHN|nr:hypothetical protein [Erythrobacter mangrovi]QKG71889.1 hypothetical protein HQR01_11260 [Erythrobacter mangrovi]
MRKHLFVGAVALTVTCLPGTALADDPRDPKMRSAEARARDAVEIRRLNQEQLRHVQRRDARLAKGWQEYRDYPAAQADYERKMAEWRRAVELCESGSHEYCAR